MNNRQTGSCYEELACGYLAGCGYKILERNFRSHYGEIDIICQDGGTIVFVEVKYRNSHEKGYPEEAVDAKKQQIIFGVSRYYLLIHNLSEDTPCRFDVITYYSYMDRKHYIDAFGGI